MNFNFKFIFTFLVLLLLYVISAQLGLLVEKQTGNKLVSILVTLSVFFTFAFLISRIANKIKTK